MKRQLSEAAECAKLIRKELKNAFPEIKFSVKSRNFSMGDAVDISWTDGPSTKQVDQIVEKYEDGKFDGMQDLYTYKSNPEKLPRAKYVQTSRRISNIHYHDRFQEMIKTHCGWENVKSLDESVKIHHYWTSAREEIGREIRDLYLKPAA